MKTQQAEALSLLFRPEKIQATLNANGVLVLENQRNREIEFKHGDPDCLIGYLWNKAKNKPLVVFESHQHKVVVSAFKSNGIAKFTMEMHVKSEDHVTAVENMVPIDSQTVTKTNLARFPRSVESTTRLSWFRELRTMLSVFNDREYQAI